MTRTSQKIAVIGAGINGATNYLVGADQSRKSAVEDTRGTAK